jgi:hypothetical protein
MTDHLLAHYSASTAYVLRWPWRCQADIASSSETRASSVFAMLKVSHRADGIRQVVRFVIQNAMAESFLSEVI